MLRYETAEQFVKVSDYNKIARLYGQEEYELKDNEYIVLCDFDVIKNLRNMVLKNENTLVINGKEYVSSSTLVARSQSNGRKTWRYPKYPIN